MLQDLEAENEHIKKEKEELDKQVTDLKKQTCELQEEIKKKENEFRKLFNQKTVVTFDDQEEKLKQKDNLILTLKKSLIEENKKWNEKFFALQVNEKMNLKIKFLKE